MTNPLIKRGTVKSSGSKILSLIFSVLATEHWALSEAKPVDSPGAALTFWVVELGVAPDASHVQRFNDLGQPIPDEISAATLDNINNGAGGYSLKVVAKGPQISSFRSVTLSKDNKGVTVVLNEADRKSLASLTREFRGRYLYWFAPGTDDLFFSHYRSDGGWDLRI